MMGCRIPDWRRIIFPKNNFVNDAFYDKKKLCEAGNLKSKFKLTKKKNPKIPMHTQKHCIGLHRIKDSRNV